MEANESSIALLGITSDVSVGARGKFPLTELDQQALYKPLTKWNTRIDRVDQIPHSRAQRLPRHDHRPPGCRAHRAAV